MRDKIKAVLFCVVLLGALAFTVGYPYTTADEVVVTVTGKERITNGDSSKYLVFTEGETFKNTDSFFYFKFNSSDLYGKLKEGRVYRLKVYGYRVPFLSWYRNIVSIEAKS